MKQCLFFWNGYEADGGGNLTLQADIQPSTAIIRMRLSYPVSQHGTLRLSDGTTIRDFTNCRVIRAVIQQGGGGARWREITIEDRRWRWGQGYAAIYGEYNIDQAGQAIVQRSVRQLAALCFEALGENRYDVSVLPADIYPPTVWDGDNPATALQELIAPYAGQIATWPNDVPRVFTLTEGISPTPDERQMDFTYGLEPAVVPRAIVYEGGETYMQHDLPLEPIGRELNGSWRHIDDLSYTPAGGWGAEDPDPNHGFMGIVDPRLRRLARLYIWRRYRIRGTFFLPYPPQLLQNRFARGYLTPTQRSQFLDYFTIDRGEEWRILPLRDKQVLVAGSTGFTGLPAEVWGFCYDLNAVNKNTLGVTGYTDIATNYPSAVNDSALITGSIPVPNALLPLQYTRPFVINPDSGHIQFDHAVFLADFIDSTRKPAVIRLRTSFTLKDTLSAARLCQQYWNFPRNSNSDVPKLLKDSAVHFEYASATGQVGSPSRTSLVSNQQAFIANATIRITDELQTYKVGQGYSSPYKGFVFDKPIDGVVRTIVWDVSERGEGTTHIDYNMERPEAYPTLLEIRARRQATFRLWKDAQIKAKINTQPTKRGKW